MRWADPLCPRKPRVGGKGSFGCGLDRAPMADLAESAGGLVALVAIGLALAFLLRELVRTVTNRREMSRTERRLDDDAEREEINRLRHRDIEAFIVALNARRKRLGGTPIDPSELRKRQFDTTYAVDSILLDTTKMKRLKKKIKEAALEGEEIVLKEEPEKI